MKDWNKGLFEMNHKFIFLLNESHLNLNKLRDWKMKIFGLNECKFGS